jgi:flagellar hook-length control protein FliK
VLSVSSEAASNAAFQGASQRPAWSNQVPASDLFDALVSHNTTADAARASQPAPSPRRTEETAPAADAAAATANSTSSPPPGNDPCGTNAGPPRAGANTSASAGAAQPSTTKSGNTQGGSTKPTGSEAAGDASSADPTILAQQAGPLVTAPTLIPVSVTLPVSPTPTNVPATPLSGGTMPPLAIAAAAIAATSQALSPQAGTSAPGTTDSNTGTSATTTTLSGASATRITPSAAVTTPVTAPVIGQTTQAGSPPANAATLTSAVAATAPIAPKTTSEKSSISTAAADDQATADPSAINGPAVAQNGVPLQPAAGGKPETPNAAVEATTADAGAASSPPIAVRERSGSGNAGHALTDSPDAGTQTNGAFQPQPNPAATTAATGAALTVTAATNGPVPLSGLALEIAASVRGGKSRFEIRLDPADLGRIDVRIDIDRNGQVTSHLTVERPETLSMLRQDAPQLQRALDEAGLKTGDGGLQFSLRDQSSSGQNDGSDARPNAQRLIIIDEDTLPAAVAGRTYGRPSGPTGGVDIRV